MLRTKIIKWYKAASLTVKLKSSYYVVILIPTLFFTLLFLFTFSTLMRSQLKLEAENVVKQNILDIDNKVEQVESSLNYVTSNYSVKEFLTNTQLSYDEIRELATNNIGPLLYNIILSSKTIYKMEIYLDRELLVLKDLVKTPENVRDSTWYKETEKSNEPIWWYENQQLFVTKKIVDDISKEPIGIVKLVVNEDMITDSVKHYLSLPALIEIIHNDKIISSIETTNNKGKKNYQLKRNLKMNNNWKIHYSISSSYFKPVFNNMLYLTLLLFLLCLILVSALIQIISKSILKRVFVLTYQMKKVEEGELTIDIDTTWGDEIGILSRSFERMIGKINNLINTVYKKDMTQKELEINLLKAKINPHFLYNILSTINWLALENKDFKISKITTDLATFYRTALNQGSDISTIENEIKNIKAYIELQLVARDYSFDVSYDIDLDCFDIKIPTFILQPLVENAIVHGVDQKRLGRGAVVISAKIIKDSVIISVIDNGPLLYSGHQEVTIPYDEFGYGLKNVSERLNLFFEQDIIVDITGSPQGTVASFSFINIEKSE